MDCLVSAGTSGATVHYVDPTGVTIFALLRTDRYCFVRFLPRPPAPKLGSS